VEPRGCSQELTWTRSSVLILSGSIVALMISTFLLCMVGTLHRPSSVGESVSVESPQPLVVDAGRVLSAASVVMQDVRRYQTRRISQECDYDG